MSLSYHILRSRMKPKREPSGTVTWASAQGDRHHQEDRAVHEWVETRAGAGWLLAVFDGHRGSTSAEKAAQELPAIFRKSMLRYKGDSARALAEVFHSLHGLTQNNRSGSTASVVFVKPDGQSATLAALGDSPVAILDSQGQAHTGPDHNVRTNLQDRAAAVARGGLYRAGYLEDSETPGVGLQMARSLGDMELSRVL